MSYFSWNRNHIDLIWFLTWIPNGPIIWLKTVLTLSYGENAIFHQVLNYCQLRVIMLQSSSTITGKMFLSLPYLTTILGDLKFHGNPFSILASELISSIRFTFTFYLRILVSSHSQLLSPWVLPQKSNIFIRPQFLHNIF